MKFVWPVAGDMYAVDPLSSLCQGNNMDGHYGYDYYAEDGNIVYAAFDGTLRRFNESPKAGSYTLGCALQLDSTDGKMTAYYGHLLLDSVLEDDTPVVAGNAIAKSGGGQENEFCRGSSTGPRLYFELVDNQKSQWVDPSTCAVNTCKFWYTLDGYGDQQCTPNLLNAGNCKITPVSKSGQWDANDIEYNFPSYSCFNNGDWNKAARSYSKNRYYAEITINEYGRINLSCSGTDDYRRCESEIYGYDANKVPTPLIARGISTAEDLNCFLRFLRVGFDGKTTCGRIRLIGGDPVVEWGGIPCDISGLGLDEKGKSRNVGYKNVFDVTKVESDDYNKEVVVSNEYTIVAIDDHDLLDKSASRISNPLNNQDFTYFNKNKDPYTVDYILARTCDLGGTVEISSQCKNTRIYSEESGLTYNKLISGGTFSACKYSLVDAGRYYDKPGDYLSKFRFSRLAANRGEIYFHA
jgi:hypothetical protein